MSAKRTHKTVSENVHPRGIAMVLVLIALAMATVLGLSFLNTQSLTTGIAQNVTSQSRARGIAESAMEMTIDYLRTQSDWRDKGEGTWLENKVLDGGVFTIEVQDGVIDSAGNVSGDNDLSDEVTDHVVITAVGYYEGVAHTIRAEVTPEAGDATPASVVLVVKDADALSTQEGYRKAQLEDWGYTVSVVSANASQSTFDELSKTTDVFLVSETIYSGNLNTKLLDSGSGIVNEEPALYDDFNLTSGSASEYVHTDINITNTSHDITSGLSSGVTTVFSHSQKMQYVESSSLPDGAVVLATNPDNGQPALIVVDTGKSLQSGSAAGRRVFLPWATSSLDFSSLNSTGLDLLKRCIDWASQKTTASSPSLHYDFSEQSGSVIGDKYGNIGLQISAGNGAITWVTDANGQGIQFTQDSDNGSAVAITSASTNSQDLADAIKNANAITVQVFFKQTDGSSDGGYILSMANKDSDGGGSGDDEEDDDDEGHGGGHGSLDHQGTYVEFTDLLNDPNTKIFYRYGGCGGGGDEDDDDDSSTLYDNFYVYGSPSGNSFNQRLYLRYDDGDVTLNQSSAWEKDTAVVYAFTYDKNDGKVRIYINGTQIATQTASNTNLENWVSQWLTLGNSPSLNQPFVGIIYDVKIWPTQLVASQLKTNADTLLGVADSEDKPQLLVRYTFNEVDPVAPQLISQWKLNETTGPSIGGATYGGGASSHEKMVLKSGAQISGYRSSTGNWGGSNSNLNVNVSTNATSYGKFSVKNWNTKVIGDAFCGQGGNPNSVITEIYSGEVTGDKSALTENFDLPDTYDPPTGGKPSHTDEVEYKGYHNYYTLDSNVNCDDFTVKSDAQLTISGDVIIWCENFELKDWSSRIYVPQGSSLTVYATEKIIIKSGAQLNYQSNDTTGASRVNMFTCEGDDIEIESWNTRVVGNFYSTGNFTIDDDAVLYGTVACHKQLEVKGWSARLYVDLDQVSGGASGTKIADDEKGVSDGTYTNGPITEDAGKFDSAIKFDGENDYVLIPHNDAYLLNTGTVSFWFKANDLSGTQGLFSKDSEGFDTGGHLSIYLEGSELKARLQSTSASLTVSETSISANVWHHVAFTFGPAGMKLIVDGSIADTDTYIGGLSTTSGGNGNYEPIVLGASTMHSGNLVATPVENYFNGYMDDVRIYGSPLTTTQIAIVMEDGSPGTDSAVGLVVKDTGGYGQPLDMTIIDPENITWDDNGGLTFTGPNRVISNTHASKITSALQTSGALTVEMIFTPATLEQEGNIVSISSDSSNRNLSIAQNNSAYSFSLRTSDTSSDASPAVESGNVLTVAQQHLVITWDGSTIKIYRNGDLESTQDRSGDLSNWSSTLHLIMGNEADNSAPWQGFLKRVTLYDQTLNSLQVEDLFNGESPRANTATQPIEFHVRWYENP